MKLLVDVGNSCIKWAYLENGKLSGHGAVNQHGYQLDGVLGEAWRKLAKPAAVLVANVAGPMANHVINQLSQELFGITPWYLISSEQAGGVRNGYLDPTRLGVDRWAALIGVHNRYQTPACVIDCGTAITLDAINAQGQHLGGLIAPGIALMRHSLVGATSAIADEGDQEEISIFAQDTRAAVAGGALNAAVALIERVSQRMLGELGEGARCYVTGGEAPRVLPHLQDGFTLIPNLVLEGLAVIAEQRQ